jgi:hypothetical protein
MTQPDRRRDDSFFADLFPSTGSRTSLAQMMNTSPSSVTQQLAPESDVKSYYHAGKCALYAADMIDRMEGGHRGEVLWLDLVESRQEWLGKGRAAVTRFPARLAHEVIEVELNTAEIHQVPVARRKEKIRTLIKALEAYYAGIDDGDSSRDGEGPQAGQAGADTQRPRPVAASGQ